MAYLAEFAAVAPQPAEDVNITPNVNPEPPPVHVAHLASMTPMQAASPDPAAGDQMPIGGGDTGTQW